MFNFFSNIDSKIKKMQKPDFISLYRDSIMGFAILWVVLLHSGVDFGKTGLLSNFILFIKYTGYLGVDIFFFVSGFGLMVGRYKMKYSTYTFYKRRFLRIMPLYWTFLTLAILLFGTTKNFSYTFIEYTGFGFLISMKGQWFITAILLCYMIFPFFAEHLEKGNRLRFLIIVVILCLCLAIILTFSAFFFANKFSFLLILILRLPAFLIGSFIGYIYIKKDASYNYLFSIYFHSILIFFCYIALALIYYFVSSKDRNLYGVGLYPFVLSAFSLTLLLSILFNILSKHFGYLLTILNKIGKSSLELFFIHFLVFDNIIMIQSIFNYLDISLEGNYLWFVGMFTSVLFAIVFNSVWSNLFLYKYLKGT